MAITGNRQGSPDVGTTNWDTTAAQQSGNQMPGTEGQGIAKTLRETTYRQLDDQKARASDTLGSLAGAVRGMTQPLRDSGQTNIADYVNNAADGIERWAGSLKHQNVDDALRAAKQFARRQPALFIGAAFTAGMLAARFLKSSGDDFDGSRQFGGSRGPRPMGTTDYAASPYGTTSTSGDIPRLRSDRYPTSTGEVI